MSVHESHALPWRVVECRPGAWDGDDRCDGIRDADGFRVVTTDSGVYEPDLVTARFIVTACNSHHDLLEELRSLVTLLDGPLDMRGHVDGAIRNAKRAIATAEG